MRWTHWLLLLCLTTAMSAMASDNVALVWPSNLDTRTLPNGALDDPQPDTLLYDNNSPAILSTATNFWCRVRFTAPVDFSLISAYCYTIDGTNSQAPCSCFVFTSTPAPGGEQAIARAAAPLPNFGWFDVNFNDTVNVVGGTDFWVVFGPIPGGPQGDANWNPVYDNGITGDRSQISTQGKFGTYSNLTGDIMFRVGGIAGGVFTDLSAGDLSNEVAGETSYNFLSGQSVFFTQEFENVGTQDITAYVGELTVTGPGGTEVFSEDLIGGALDAEATANLTTGTPFTPTAEGEYLARCIALAGDDNNQENDTTWLRFFVGGNHRWYRYDDDEDADSYLGFSAGSGWALKFKPATYPAAITRVRVDVGGAATGDFRIWMNDSQELPTGTPVWTSTPAVVSGWNEITVTPPILVFEGQSVTFGTLFETGAPMGFDDNPPNAAQNIAMGLLALQIANDGAQFFEDDGGNLCMQVFFDTTSATPPFPVIDTDRDTVDFGRIRPSAPGVSQTLTVFNEGGQDALNVTSITITPNATAPAYQITPTSFTVAAGASRDVTITFDPPLHRSWNGIITINSNAGNNAAFPVILRGIGDSTASAVHETNLPLPSEFSMGQNYPNPFNPTTDIQFSLPVQSNVRLTVVNMLGQEVAVLANGNFSAGVYTASFDAVAMPSGLYFYRMDAGDFTSVRKMMLLK
ncbi:MAG: T9SS type A sorting domain-containing protein [bacterium]|nr:T9SS type A sorting domain-containing protein [bacterium]